MSYRFLIFESNNVKNSKKTLKKSPCWFYAKHPKKTIIPSLVPIGWVVSEEKSFEKLLTRMDNDDNGCQMMAIKIKSVVDECMDRQGDYSMGV